VLRYTLNNRLVSQPIVYNHKKGRLCRTIFTIVFAIVDIEATGGSPKTARIMEIAIVVHNGERVIEEFSSLVNPQKKIDPFVVALTGISDEMVEDSPTFEDLAPKIAELTKDRIFVAHNVSFDYGFLRNEFSRIGVRFQRPNLCTVKMSQKLLPGHSSYSLGNLCNDLDIPVKNRHRALGDASATAVLLEKILFSDQKHLLDNLLKNELETASFPANISAEEVDQLPEDIGVYYFKNEKDQTIYIGKSKNIRKRVLQHFQNDKDALRFKKMKEQIHSIDYQITGSELIAEIVESGEIKRFMPEYNRAQKRKKYRFGLFVEEDKDGYMRLDCRLLNPDRRPFIQFTRKRSAEKALLGIRKKGDLTQETRIKTTPEEYNKKVVRALEKYNFSKPNLLIIDHGRNFFEKSVVQIEHGNYVGYGFFSIEEEIIQNPADIISFIKQDYNSPNKEAIIRKYLRKKNSFQLIPYSPEMVLES